VIQTLFRGTFRRGLVDAIQFASPATIAAPLPFWCLPVAAATVSPAEQDAVEPQASKGRCWAGSRLRVPVQYTSCHQIQCDYVQHPSI